MSAPAPVTARSTDYPAGLDVAGECSSCGAPVPAWQERCIHGHPRAVFGPAFPHKAEGWTRIVQLTDLHLGVCDDGRRNRGVLLRALDCAEAIAVDVVAITGDLVEDPTDGASLDWLHDRMTERGLEWLAIPGNHDAIVPGRPFEAATRDYGTYPRVQTFGSVEFILVDSLAGVPPEARRGIECVFAAVAVYTEGRVGDAVRAEVDDLLGEEGPPRVLLVHHHLTHHMGAPKGGPLVGVPDSGGTMFMQPLEDAREVYDWCAARRIGLVLHGHRHRTATFLPHRGDLVVVGAESSTTGEDPSFAASTGWSAPAVRLTVVDISPRGDRRVSIVSLEKPAPTPLAEVALQLVEVPTAKEIELWEEAEAWRCRESGFLANLMDKPTELRATGMDKAVDWAEDAIRWVPGGDWVLTAADAVAKAVLEVLHAVIVKGIRPAAILSDFPEPIPGSFEEISALPLDAVDRARRFRSFKYEAVARMVGVVAFPIPLPTNILDVATMLIWAARGIVQEAAYHGFNPVAPIEQLYLLGLVGVASSVSSSDRDVQLGELDQLELLMADGHEPTEKELSEAMRDTLRTLLRVWSQRSSQWRTNPGGFNQKFVGACIDAAGHAYDRRFLVNRYGSRLVNRWRGTS